MTHSMTVPDAVTGLVYEADYETEGDGSGPSYSPMYGADSGDPLVILLLLNVYHEEYGDATLTAEEEEAFTAYICANHEFDGYDADL